MAEKQFNNVQIKVEFEETANRQQIVTGDNLPTLFSKIKKFFSDLKTVSFSGSYNDLSDIPTSLPANGGNAATVNSHTVEADVPADAKFTDTTYSAGESISISGTTINNSGVRSVATGSTNGTISVNTGGTTANVSVKGLASAAYQAVQTTASTVGLHRISSGSDEATTTNCPAGCWYGQYE